MILMAEDTIFIVVQLASEEPETGRGGPGAGLGASVRQAFEINRHGQAGLG